MVLGKVGENLKEIGVNGTWVFLHGWVYFLSFALYVNIGERWRNGFGKRD